MQVPEIQVKSGERGVEHLKKLFTRDNWILLGRITLEDSAQIVSSPY